MKSFIEISLISVLFLGGYLADATGSYIVALKSSAKGKVLDDHLARVRKLFDSDQHSRGKNKIRYVYRKVLTGYSAEFTDAFLAKVKAMKEVDSIEKNKNGKSDAIQKNAPWGLTRLSSHKTLEKSNGGSYHHDPKGGDGVDVYVIDTGIKIDHPDFEGRARWGENFADDVDTDERGHGTHVAGIIGSKIHGVAKKSTLIALKVLDTNGKGELDKYIAAVEWAVNDKKEGRGCIINISLGEQYSKIFNTAARNTVQQWGCVVIASAGNEGKDACSKSPGSEPSVITVGATDLFDSRADFSNWGECVTLFAPGVDIYSTALYDVDRSESGTSMAAPHVAGLAAIVLSKNKN
ncbi:proteinase B [Entomophthora muscae]|uniref:Proteinase B n=1 Tax=Entomophthora muscae TaxID=34485 RepID=A0ACC2RW85_9FUNG|nr:proteinase B [Entomophthora muscae]